MEELHFYHIPDDYVEYLFRFDSRVQCNKNAHRPYIGIVLDVNGIHYFVPMESPKPNHITMKPGKHILKLANGRLGILGFNNMIPVPDRILIPFNIHSVANTRYRLLLLDQHQICTEIRQLICERAEITYSKVVREHNPFFMRICCDFRKLEAACKEYR